eukprot:PhF_6_TR13456/c0_g1_i1/m.21559
MKRKLFSPSLLLFPLIMIFWVTPGATDDFEMMTSFVQGFTCHDPTWNDTVVCNWKGYTCPGIPANSFTLSSSSCSGTVNFTALPSSVIDLNLENNTFEGIINTSSIPSTVRFLNIANNKFTGEFDANRLPVLVNLDISQNKFQGNFNASALLNAVDLRVGNNNFSGQVNLTTLSPTLTSLYLNNNTFSGSIDLTSLPPNLENLYLDTNSFSGTVDLTKLPSSLKLLQLGTNKFSGTVNLTGLPPTLTQITLSKNNFSGYFNFSLLPASLTNIYLGSTNFTGGGNLSTLVKLTTLGIINSSFCSDDVIVPCHDFRLHSSNCSVNRTFPPNCVLSCPACQKVNLTESTVSPTTSSPPTTAIPTTIAPSSTTVVPTTTTAPNTTAASSNTTEPPATVSIPSTTTVAPTTTTDTPSPPTSAVLPTTTTVPSTTIVAPTTTTVLSTTGPPVMPTTITVNPFTTVAPPTGTPATPTSTATRPPASSPPTTRLPSPPTSPLPTSTATPSVPTTPENLLTLPPETPQTFKTSPPESLPPPTTIQPSTQSGALKTNKASFSSSNLNYVSSEVSMVGAPADPFAAGFLSALDMICNKEFLSLSWSHHPTQAIIEQSMHLGALLVNSCFVLLAVVIGVICTVVFPSYSDVSIRLAFIVYNFFVISLSMTFSHLIAYSPKLTSLGILAVVLYILLVPFSTMCMFIILSRKMYTWNHAPTLLQVVAEVVSEKYRPKYWWYPFAPLVLNTAFGIVVGLHELPCEAVLYTLTGIQFLSAAVLILAQPHRDITEYKLESLKELCKMVLMNAATVSMTSEFPQYYTSLAFKYIIIAVMVFSILRFCVKKWNEMMMFTAVQSHPTMSTTTPYNKSSMSILSVFPQTQKKLLFPRRNNNTDIVQTPKVVTTTLDILEKLGTTMRESSERCSSWASNIRTQYRPIVEVVNAYLRFVGYVVRKVGPRGIIVHEAAGTKRLHRHQVHIHESSPSTGLTIEKEEIFVARVEQYDEESCKVEFSTNGAAPFSTLRADWHKLLFCEVLGDDTGTTVKRNKLVVDDLYEIRPVLPHGYVWKHSRETSTTASSWEVDIWGNKSALSLQQPCEDLFHDPTHFAKILFHPNMATACITFPDGSGVTIPFSF